MPTKLAQVVAYIEPALKDKIQKEIDRSKDSRLTISSYIDSVLRKHFKKS